MYPPLRWCCAEILLLKQMKLSILLLWILEADWTPAWTYRPISLSLMEFSQKDSESLLTCTCGIVNLSRVCHVTLHVFGRTLPAAILKNGNTLSTEPVVSKLLNVLHITRHARPTFTGGMKTDGPCGY